MSIQSQSPLSPTGKENEYEKASPTFSFLLSPLEAHLPYLTRLTSRCNKPITYTFDHQVRGLATALLGIEPRLRRVKGYKSLPRLRIALQKDLKIDTHCQDAMDSD